MSDKPLVSVVTPSINAARFIEKTIESVHRQDYPFVEHIVMDGQSNDGTIQILQKYPHLVWTSETDRGQSHALNKGFQRAKGEIIGWLNADDVHQPGAISRAVDFLQKNPHVDFVYSDCVEIDENSLFIRLIKGHPANGYKDFVFRQPIPQPTIFFRRKVLDKLVGVDEDLHYVMDWELWLRASIEFRFAYLAGEQLAGFRKYPGSKSHTSPRRFNEEWVRVLHRWVENSKGLNPHLIERGIRYQKALLDIADVLVLAQNKERLKAIGKWFDAIREFPSIKMLKTLVHLLLVILVGRSRGVKVEAKKPINILYVQSGRGVGGAKISLLHLVKSLDHDKVNAYLALSPPSDDIFNELSELHVVSLYLPIWYKNLEGRLLGGLLILLSKVRRGWYIVPVVQLVYFILKHKIDLVHSNSSASPVGAFSAWLTRRPHVWHVREPIGSESEFPLILGDRITASLMKMLSRQILCISEFTAQFFIRNNVHPQVVLNGINVHEFEFASGRGSVLRQKFGLENKIVIAMVGSLRANWKEHGLFLKAMAMVLEKSPDARFVVFGGTSDLEITAYTRSLNQLSHELNLTDRIIWADRVDDISAMMYSFDILVHPASKEGSGRVIMEAMAAARPVITVKVGGAQELIQDKETGLLVESGNPSALAEATISLINDPEMLQRMSLQSSLYARANFSHERTASQVFQIYQQALRKPVK